MPKLPPKNQASFFFSGGRIQLPPLLVAAFAVVMFAIVLSLSSQKSINNPPKAATNLMPTSPFLPTKQPITNAQPIVANQQTAPLLSTYNLPSIIDSTFSWTDKQRNAQGVYFGNYECISGTCTQGYVNNSAGTVSSWAYYRHYLVTKNTNDIAHIQKDLTIYTDKTKVRSVQSAFWGCKLLYELGSSNLPELTQIKDLAAQLCKRVINNPMDLQLIDGIINSGSFVEPDLRTLVSTGTLKSQITGIKSGSPEAAALSSEYVAKNKWFGDPKDLTRAKLYFEKAVSALDTSVLSQDSAPVLGIATLDLYSTTKQGEYLQYAKNLFGALKTSCTTMNECAFTSLFSFQLAEITGDTQYKQTGSSALSYAVSLGYDETGKQGYRTNQLAFHAVANSSDIYSVFDNLLLAGVLSMYQ